MRQELMNLIADMEDVIGLLKNTFVAKDEIIEMLVVCAIAQEHMLIVGPPGTAKSEIAKRFAMLCSPRAGSQNGDIPYFEYLLTRFTEPNEIFGPVDIGTFQKGGGHRRMTDGMLPRAEILFLDEVFKANSAILNALLNILNERVFYNGGKPEPVPLISAVGAANEVPDDTTLAALFDRFLVRVWTDNVEEASFAELFHSGWRLVRDRIQTGYAIDLGNVTTTDVLRQLYLALDEVDMSGIDRQYREAVRDIRAEGIELSDRRVINLLKLIGASALRRRSLEANTGDFWVLRHVWNTQEQVSHLRRIVEPYLDGYEAAFWRTERKPEVIEGDITALGEREGLLETDADYGHFLKEAGRLRRELMNHSDESGTGELLERVNMLIEKGMALLEERE
ncbi:AAA family ATPase [Desulfococcaceae bacterium HSG8]|nr:AAA family ATPase [Desulfococcaceae bacterium HSG8]